MSADDDMNRTIGQLWEDNSVLHMDGDLKTARRVLNRVSLHLEGMIVTHRIEGLELYGALGQPVVDDINAAWKSVEEALFPVGHAIAYLGSLRSLSLRGGESVFEPKPGKLTTACDGFMADRPEEGKVYALTGGPGTPSIESGASWAESVVPEPGFEAFRQKLLEYPEEADEDDYPVPRYTDNDRWQDEADKDASWRQANPDDESFDMDSAVRELIAPDAYATCSLCKERIELRKRKVTHAFIEKEVATHFKEKHPEAVTPIGIPYCVITLE